MTPRPGSRSAAAPLALGAWLRSGRPFMPALIAAAVLGALVLITPLRTPMPAGEVAAGAGLPDSTTSGALTGAPGGGVAAAGAQVAAGHDAGSGTVSSAAQLTGGHGPGGSASGLPASTVGNSYQGVTATTVKWGFSAQDKPCGGFSQNETAAAYGLSSNPTTDYQVNLEYWNKYPLTDYPLPSEIRAHVNPKVGYWGRRITSVF